MNLSQDSALNKPQSSPNTAEDPLAACSLQPATRPQVPPRIPCRARGALPHLHVGFAYHASLLESPVLLPLPALTAERSPTTGIPPPLFRASRPQAGANEGSAASFLSGLRTTSALPPCEGFAVPARGSPLVGQERGRPQGCPACNVKPLARRESLANDDGYHWRKYGEKHVKGSTYPRSYYKCSHQGCHCKKIVERDPSNGVVSSTLYKGSHSHAKPTSWPERAGSVDLQRRQSASSEPSPVQAQQGSAAQQQQQQPHRGGSAAHGHMLPIPMALQSHAAPPSSDSSDDGNGEDADLPEAQLKREPPSTAIAAAAAAVAAKRKREADHVAVVASSSSLASGEDDPGTPAKRSKLKRQSYSVGHGEHHLHGASATVLLPHGGGGGGFAMHANDAREDRTVVELETDADTMDDGYRWRKYGQKLVKGNSHPRSYYKCTYQGCPVRKHVERSGDDVRKLVTTYEGFHNHERPAPSAQHVRGLSRRASASLALAAEAAAAAAATVIGKPSAEVTRQGLERAAERLVRAESAPPPQQAEPSHIHLRTGSWDSPRSPAPLMSAALQQAAANYQQAGIMGFGGKVRRPPPYDLLALKPESSPKSPLIHMTPGSALNTPASALPHSPAGVMADIPMPDIAASQAQASGLDTGIAHHDHKLVIAPLSSPWRSLSGLQTPELSTPQGGWDFAGLLNTPQSKGCQPWKPWD